MGFWCHDIINIPIFGINATMTIAFEWYQYSIFWNKIAIKGEAWHIFAYNLGNCVIMGVKRLSAMNICRQIPQSLTVFIIFPYLSWRQVRPCLTCLPWAHVPDIYTVICEIVTILHLFLGLNKIEYLTDLTLCVGSSFHSLWRHDSTFYATRSKSHQWYKKFIIYLLKYEIALWGNIAGRSVQVSQKCRFHDRELPGILHILKNMIRQTRSQDSSDGEESITTISIYIHH